MSIADSIKKDHDEFRAMIAKLQKTTVRDSEERRRTFSTLRRNVFAHFKAEEGTVLPEMLKVDDLKILAMDLMEEHRALRGLFDGVKATRCDDEMWLSRLTPVAGLLAIHMGKEENMVIPAAPKYFTDAQLDALGRVFETIETKELGQMVTA